MPVASSSRPQRLSSLKVGEIETVKAVTIDGYKVKDDETQTITAALSANAKDYIITFTYEKSLPAAIPAVAVPLVVAVRPAAAATVVVLLRRQQRQQ